MSFFKEEWRVLTVAALVILVGATLSARLDKIASEQEVQAAMLQRMHTVNLQARDAARACVPPQKKR